MRNFRPLLRPSLLLLLLVVLSMHRAWAEQGAQADRKTKAGAKFKAVEFAPEAELINGIDDVDPEGNCQDDIASYCNDTKPGEGALSDCLSDIITESESEGESQLSVTDSCREAVYQFKIERDSNINHNVPLAKACKVDAEKNCNVTWMFGYKAGQVIFCLRDVKDKLSPACRKQVFKVQQDAAEDFRADVSLYNACKDDSQSLCAGVKEGAGRVQACLRDNRLKLSWPCEEQLFRQESENADDIRLSARLFLKCLPDKRRYCKEVEPGNANVKDCLEEHRLDSGFSAPCKEEVDAMIERRAADFRLDTRLRKACEEDISSMCSFFGDLDSMASNDFSVIKCLQDYLSEIKSEKCQKTVMKMQELSAQDIRFDAPLAYACGDDRKSFCANIPPGSARVIRCLQKQRDKLSPMCRATFFDEEVRFSHNIDFQYPMKKACEREIDDFCAAVPHGDATVIRCLQDNQYVKDFSKACKEQVRQYEMEASTDYRLNSRLSKVCKADIDAMCIDACKVQEGEVCGGTVLQCLTEKMNEIADDECQKEVFYFEKMEVNNYNNDVILAAACRTDVDKFCAEVEAGEGRVHECLRQNRKGLSEGCRREELLLEEQEAENIELHPGILRSCKQERKMFCKDVAPGQARVFRCLAEKMGDLDFGEQCRLLIIGKLQRRQANWKLDPPLRKACKDSVFEYCSSEDKTNSESGTVYKCLARKYDDLDSSCQKELGRAVHMAFFGWQPNGTITSDCDADVQRLCLIRRPNMAKSPGSVGACLQKILDEMSASGAEVEDETAPKGPPALGPGGGPRVLSKECRDLAAVAEPPDMKEAFDASLSVVLLQSQLSTLESTTGMQMLNRDPKSGQAQSITLTGWTALAGISALVVLIGWGGYQGWRRFNGQPDGGAYSLVVKTRRG